MVGHGFYIIRSDGCIFILFFLKGYAIIQIRILIGNKE